MEHFWEAISILDFNHILIIVSIFIYIYINIINLNMYISTFSCERSKPRFFL